MEEAQEQGSPTETINLVEPIAEEKEPIHNNHRVPKYIHSRDYPIVQSVGNSGWQVSDIWKDVRVDNFCGN